MLIDEMIDYGSEWDDETFDFMVEKAQEQITAEHLTSLIFTFDGYPDRQAVVLDISRAEWGNLKVEEVEEIVDSAPAGTTAELLEGYLHLKQNISPEHLYNLKASAEEKMPKAVNDKLISLIQACVKSGQDLLDALANVTDEDAFIKKALDSGLMIDRNTAIELIETWCYNVSEVLAKTDGGFSLRELIEFTDFADDNDDILAICKKAKEQRIPLNPSQAYGLVSEGNGDCVATILGLIEGPLTCAEAEDLAEVAYGPQYGSVRRKIVSLAKGPREDLEELRMSYLY